MGRLKKAYEVGLRKRVRVSLLFIHARIRMIIFLAIAIQIFPVSVHASTKETSTSQRACVRVCIGTGERDRTRPCHASTQLPRSLRYLNSVYACVIGM